MSCYFSSDTRTECCTVKAWTERHAQYMSQPRIEETESFLEITANAPRPLHDVLAALAHQHGWHINYQDPQYGKSEILDDTAPLWLELHPNGRRAYGIAGGAFHVKIPIDGYFPDDHLISWSGVSHSSSFRWTEFSVLSPDVDTSPGGTRGFGGWCPATVCR